MCNRQHDEVANETSYGYHGEGKSREREYFWVLTVDVQELAGPVGCSQCSKFCGEDDFSGEFVDNKEADTTRQRVDR